MPTQQVIFKKIIIIYYQTKGNLSLYTESMNILNLSPDDLEDFLEPQTRSEANMKRPVTGQVTQDEMDKFE